MGDGRLGGSGGGGGGPQGAVVPNDTVVHVEVGGARHHREAGRRRPIGQIFAAHRRAPRDDAVLLLCGKKPSAIFSFAFRVSTKKETSVARLC